MDILTTFEILGATSALGLGYLTAQSHGFGAKYWTLKDDQAKTSHRDAAHIRRTWRRLARNLNLSLRDDVPTLAQQLAAKDGRKPEPKILTPKLLAINPDVYGLSVDFKPLPGVGLDEFAKATQHLANHWGMTRVGVEQPDPRTIRVRAVRTDPLLTKRVLARPAAVARGLDYVPIGIDDYARMVRLQLSHSTGVGVYGAPRWGKTSLILGIMAALAPYEEVQFVLADGKVSTGFEGDYYDIAHRCLAVIGDSIADYNALIKEVAKLRKARQSVIRQELGVPNFWDVGPSKRWPLLLVVIDEAHSFFRQVSPVGNRADLKEQNSLAAENAWETEQLVKLCGAVGIYFVIGTQKPTADAIPTAIRANLTHGLCLGVREESVAVAALGESIKNYPDANPMQFMRDSLRGCASMVSEADPGFVRFRSPYCPPQLVSQTAAQTKHLVASASANLPLTVGRAHLGQLPDSPAALLPAEPKTDN